MWDSLPDIVRLLLALALVVGLMGGLALIIKKAGLQQITNMTGNNNEKRLRIIETMPLDSRRRVVLIERDSQQHLVLLGINSDTVIERNIDSQKERSKDT